MATQRVSKIRRWLIAIAIGLAVLLTLVVAVLRLQFNGAALGARVADTLNAGMRGRLEIGSIDWDLPELRKVVTGGWLPVTIQDVKVFDDGNPRTLLLESPRITAEIDLHSLMLDQRFNIRRVVVHGGATRLVQTTEPYQLHDYDTTIISLLVAFYPKAVPQFRAGYFASSPPPIFDLRDLELRGVDVGLYFGVSGAANQDFTIAMWINDLDVKTAPEGIGRPFLYADNTDPLVSRMYFSINPKTQAAPGAEVGHLEIGALGADTHAWPTRFASTNFRIGLASVDVQRLAQLPRGWPQETVANTLEIDATLVTTEGGRFHVTGNLLDWWDRPYDGQWALEVDAQNLGPTLNASIDPTLSGANVHAKLRLDGPFVLLPRISFEASGLEWDALTPNDPADAPLRLAFAKVGGWFDPVSGQGLLNQSEARVIGGQGAVQVAAAFTDTLRLDAALDVTEPIDARPFMPPMVASTLGGFVTGKFAVRGNAAEGLAIEDFDLALGRTPTERLTKIDRGRLVAENDFTTIEAEDLRLTAGQSRITLDGGVNLTSRTLAMDVRGDSPDLATWLARLGAPAVARRADRISATISGSLDAPRVDAKASLGGVPTVDKLDVVASYEDGAVQLDSLSSGGLGGSLAGSGRIRLGDVPFIEGLELRGRGLSGAALPTPAGLVAGTIDEATLSVRGSLRARDPLAWLGMARGFLRADALTLGGEPLEDARLCLNDPRDSRCRRPSAPLDGDDLADCATAKAQGGVCLVGSATRPSGGAIDVTVSHLPGTRTREAKLGGTVALQALPVALVSKLLADQGIALPAGGELSTILHLGGTPDRPYADGTVDLLRAWLGDAVLGNAQLALTHAQTPGWIEIAGTALAGRAVLRGRMQTTAPYAVDIELRAHRVEVDPLIDVQALAGLPGPVRGWTSGRVSLYAELGNPAQAPIVWVELDELVATYEHRDADGRPLPLRLTTVPSGADRPALSVRLTPESVALTCRAADAPATTREHTPCPIRLATPAGVLTLTGDGSREAIKLDLAGALDLALLGPLLAPLVDEIGGRATIAAAVRGSLAQPTFDAELSLDDVYVRQTGQDAIARIPTGVIKLGNNSIGFSDVKVTVDDATLGSLSELTVRGGIGLKGFTPATWGVIVEGQVAGKLLMALAPKEFSQASGIAIIEDNLTLYGRGAVPQIMGTLVFDPRQPFAVVPRRLRREIAVKAGSISISDQLGDDGARSYLLEIEDLVASIDGEGTVKGIAGEIELGADGLIAADVRADAEGIPFRIPGELDLVLNGDDLRLSGGQAVRWRITGDVEIVSGRYFRNLNVGTLLSPTASSGAVAVPVWESVPWLGNADLAIGVDLRQFAYRNNLFNIEFGGGVTVFGTPNDPRIDGQIDVKHGEFRIPGTAPRFTRTEGSAVFSRQLKFPAMSPNVDVTSRSDFRDQTGQDHTITLVLRGSLSNLTWDLYTSTGLDKSDTVALIVFGKSSEQLKGAIGSEAIGTAPTQLDPTTSQASNPLDQLVKDYVGDSVSTLISERLRNIKLVDILYPVIGINVYGVHAEKHLLENLDVVGDYENRRAVGSSISVRAEWRTPIKLVPNGNTLTLQGAYLDRQFKDDAEEDVTDLQFKLSYRLFVP